MFSDFKPIFTFDVLCWVMFCFLFLLSYLPFVENEFILFLYPDDQLHEGEWLDHRFLLFLLQLPVQRTGHKEIACQTPLSWTQMWFTKQQQQKKNKTERERERVNEQLSVELQDSFLSHSWMRSAENRGKERKEEAVRESQRVDTVSHWMTAGLLSVQWWGLVGKWYTRKQSRNEHRLTREMRSGRGPQKWRNTRTT